MSAGVSRREQGARKLIGAAATLAVLGVALNLTGDANHDATSLKLIAVAGVAAMIWSIHRYGRLGPGPVMEFAPAEPSATPRKKKKKKRKAAEPTPSESPRS